MNSLYYQIIDGIDSCVMALDHDGEGLPWNKSTETIFGYPVEEMIGKSPTGIYPAHLSEDVIKAVLLVNNIGGEQAWNGIRKDGREYGVISKPRIFITKEEVDELGGILEIKSKPDFGTRILAEVPKNRVRHEN